MRNPKLVVAAIDEGAYVNYGGALTVLLDAKMDEKEENNITSILNTLAAKGVDVNPTEEWVEGGITPPPTQPAGHRGPAPSISFDFRKTEAVGCRPAPPRKERASSLRERGGGYKNRHRGAA